MNYREQMLEELEIEKRLRNIADAYGNDRKEPDATFASALLMIMKRLDDQESYEREQAELE